MLIPDSYKYNSVDVAMYIIARANKEHLGINMTKTQKLLYIAYGACLVIFDFRLTNEHPQAWPYGPVFPTTRNKLLKCEFDSITFEDDKKLKELDEDQELQKLITFVFQGFGEKSAQALTAWSHKDGSPWERTTCLDSFKWGNQIPDEYILDYFKGIIKHE
jgi:uncharacterized phage-associated protein